MGSLTFEQFLGYIRAFNASDYTKQHSYYASGVELVLPDPQVGTLRGSEAIREHYRPIHAAAEETVIPITVTVDERNGKRVFLIMEAYFLYKKEVENAVHGYNAEPGDVFRITCWACYDIVVEGEEKGKMKRITCVLQEAKFLGKVDLKAAIRDSEGRADPEVRLYHY